MDDLPALKERAVSTKAASRDAVEDAILGVLTDDASLIGKFKANPMHKV